MAALSRRYRAILLAIVLLVLLALGLGLGLGLGLKHNSAAESQLQSQPESNFVLHNLTAQPSQTRVYNFTLSQVQGAPDGFSRPMLAVNGTSHPSPFIARLTTMSHRHLPRSYHRSKPGRSFGRQCPKQPPQFIKHPLARPGKPHLSLHISGYLISRRSSKMAQTSTTAPLESQNAAYRQAIH